MRSISYWPRWEHRRRFYQLHVVLPPTEDEWRELGMIVMGPEHGHEVERHAEVAWPRTVEGKAPPAHAEIAEVDRRIELVAEMIRRCPRGSGHLYLLQHQRLALEERRAWLYDRFLNQR